VELLPTRIRYTSISLRTTSATGWFGGMLPLLATAMGRRRRNIYQGLWYSFVVLVMAFVVGVPLVGKRRTAGSTTSTDPDGYSRR